MDRLTEIGKYVPGAALRNTNNGLDLRRKCQLLPEERAVWKHEEQI